MTKLTTILLAGVATLAFTACGSSGSSSTGGSTTPPVATPDPTEPPLSNNGNQILLPGYEYTIQPGETYEMYVSPGGRVLFNNTKCEVNVYDANYNKYADRVFTDAYDFQEGQYYLSVGSCYKWGSGPLSVESNVLYNPLAQ